MVGMECFMKTERNQKGTVSHAMNSSVEFAFLKFLAMDLE